MFYSSWERTTRYFEGYSSKAIATANSALATVTQAAIASLWQVSDRGTQALMDAFYGILQDTKLTKSKVLAKSQRVLINAGKDRNFSHPYYWSPFMIIGNGL